MHVLEHSHVDVECAIEASPKAVSYWIKEPLGRSFQQSYQHQQNVLQEGDKYNMSESINAYYRTVLRMRISNFNENDVGIYTCMASNMMGRANSTIRLFGEWNLLINEAYEWAKMSCNYSWEKVIQLLSLAPPPHKKHFNVSIFSYPHARHNAQFVIYDFFPLKQRLKFPRHPRRRPYSQQQHEWRVRWEQQHDGRQPEEVIFMVKFEITSKWCGELHKGCLQRVFSLLITFQSNFLALN